MVQWTVPVLGGAGPRAWAAPMATPAVLQQAVVRGAVDVKMFGAVGDGVTDDTRPIQAAVDFAAARNLRCLIVAGNYNITDAINTPNNAWIVWEKEAWLRPTRHSRGGAILTNVQVQPVQRSNIRLDNPQIDGGALSFTGRVRANDNAIGFAHGVSKVRINGGHIRNFIANFDNGPGGKGIGFEEGVEDVVVDGTVIENCTYATFISPTLDDPTKYVRDIRFVNVYARRCAALLWALADAGTATAPTADPRQCSAAWVRCVGEDCGHMPDLPAPGGRTEKSGAILVHGASNLSIDCRISNGAGYPSATRPAGGTRYATGYPPAGTGLIGSGLSGAIGAVFKGWGRNLQVHVEYTGACDTLFTIAFPREHKGLVFARQRQPVAATGMRLTAIAHGRLGSVLGGEAGETAGGRALAPARAPLANPQIGAAIAVRCDTPENGLVAESALGLTGVNLEVVTASGREFRGSPAAIFRAGPEHGLAKPGATPPLPGRPGPAPWN